MLRERIEHHRRDLDSGGLLAEGGGELKGLAQTLAETGIVLAPAYRLMRWTGLMSSSLAWAPVAR
ncbi:MAG: hypothetical protein QGH74_08350, partial [Candidatus Brocadiia bacterium]|nr:hypothetical protein [Candidatus Brocadiia bacterium]